MLIDISPKGEFLSDATRRSDIVTTSTKMEKTKESIAKALNLLNIQREKREIINRAVMGRARFLIYRWFFFFFLCRLNHTSLGQNSNDIIYVGGQTQTSIQPNHVRDFESRNL